MSTRQKLSKEFKDSVVVKVLNRGDKTIDEICEETGAPKTSVRNWIRASAMVSPGRKSLSQKGRMKWTPEAKLKAVFDTTSLVGSFE